MSQPLNIEATEAHAPIRGTAVLRPEGYVEVDITMVAVLDATDPADRRTLRAAIAFLTDALHAGTDRLEASSRVHPPALVVQDDEDDDAPAMPRLAALMATKSELFGR